MAIKYDRIDQLLQEGIDKDVFKGCVLLVKAPQKEYFIKAKGWQKLDNEKIKMSEKTLFDLASLTKVVGTLSFCLDLVQQGKMSLDQSIAPFAPYQEKNKFAPISIRHLLNHSAGLKAWYPLYVKAQGALAVEKVLWQLPLAYATGKDSQYSCLGYILLGLILEKIANQSIDNYLEHNIFPQLGMKKTFYQPLEKKVALRDIAWGERDSQIEKKMVASGGLKFNNWRKGFGLGMPNDGNSSYALNGISGNAGLFSTVKDLALFAENWLLSLKNKGFWSQSLCQLALSPQGNPQSAYGLGWLLFQSNLRKYQQSSSMNPFLGTAYPGIVQPFSAGELLSEKAFGHTGFTGTSLWVDPIKNLIIVLLTNHLYPSFRPGLTELRARVHNVVVSLFETSAKV